jgi:hypothetical protein
VSRRQRAARDLSGQRDVSGNVPPLGNKVARFLCWNGGRGAGGMF